MVINVIICIVAVILLLRGIFLVTYMWLLWTFYSKIMTTYSMKVYGEVVDIEMQAKSDGMNITDVCIPKIKYKLEGEKEVYCQFLPAAPKNEEERYVYAHFYPKQYHIGDKVVVFYNKKKKDDISVLPRMQMIKLFISHFVLGCFFIRVAIWGLSFVF